MQAVAYYYRVYTAALSVLAEQNTEMMLLQQAINVASGSLLDYTFAQIDMNNKNTTIATIMKQQVINSTCACYNVPKTAGGGDFFGASVMEAFNNSNGALSYNEFRTAYCPSGTRECACQHQGLWGSAAGCLQGQWGRGRGGCCEHAGSRIGVQEPACF